MVSLVVTVITVMLAFPVAYFVSFHVEPSNAKSLWLFLITIPFWTSYLIRVFLWKVILGYNGVINSALLWLGHHRRAVAVDQLQRRRGDHRRWPMPMRPLRSCRSSWRWKRSTARLLEAGQDLGESRCITFLRVTLPLAMPGVIAAVLIVFIPTIGDYVTPQLVGGPEGPMIANLIELQLLKLDNYPHGLGHCGVGDG